MSETHAVMTMVHPFTGLTVEVTPVEVGDVVEPSDFYRSATTMYDGPGGALGQWFMAGDVIGGTVVGPACNVQFLRPSTLVYDDEE